MLLFADSSNRRCKKACFIHLDSKKQRNRLAQNGAESILIAIPIFCLKTRLSIVKKHLFMRKDIALKRVFLMKYLLLPPLQVQ